MTLSCVIVAQKPWGKKRIDDIVGTGAGALNVDGGRIGIAEGQGGGAKMSSSGQTIGNFQHYEKDGFQASSTGRWPSNFCLIHSPGCERVGVKKVRGTGTAIRHNKGVSGRGWKSIGYESTKDDVSYADPDGHERVDDWKCVEGCAARKLGEQSGERKSSPFNMKHPINPETSWKMVSQAYNPTGGYNDKGTAARFFFQADWEYEKMEMICSPDCPVHKLDGQAGERPTGKGAGGAVHQNLYSKFAGRPDPDAGYGDSGGASRFYKQCDWEYEKTERTHEMTGGDVGKHEIINADVLDWAQEYKERIERGEAEPFHALLSDPPWHLKGGFMGAYWDRDGLDAISFQKETWQALAEVLHPGAFLFVFAGSRGWHRLAVAMEDAGLLIQPSIFVWGVGVVEVPPMLGWLQGQSFPKATRILKKEFKDSDKPNPTYRQMQDDPSAYNLQRAPLLQEPATDLARAWEGHRYGGQILKDAATPVIVAQKPWTNPRLDCIVETGAGALNVDGGRVGLQNNDQRGEGGRKHIPQAKTAMFGGAIGSSMLPNNIGRWPSNFALTHIPSHNLCPDCKTAHSMQEETCPSCGGELERVEGCKRVGVKRVRGSTSKEDRLRTTEHTGGHGHTMGTGWDSIIIERGYANPNGLESVDAWECAEGCVCARLGEMSGEGISKQSMRGIGLTNSPVYGSGQLDYDTKRGHNDKGTCTRFFHQSGWEHEEMECAENCPVAKLGEQSGERKDAGFVNPSERSNKRQIPIAVGGGQQPFCYGDEGTAARFFPQCGWEFEQTESGGTNDGNPDQVGETNKEGEFDEGHRPPIPLDGGCAGWKFECAKDCPVAKLDSQTSDLHGAGYAKSPGGHDRKPNKSIFGIGQKEYGGARHGDSGGASRFYHNADWSHEIAERLAMSDPVRYCPKAAKRERMSGLDDFYWRKDKQSPIGFIRIGRDEWEALGVEEERIKAETGKRVSLRAQGNIHSTIKPISLIKWIATLALPPKEYAPRRILIPFAGTFSEGIGAMLAGWEKVTGVEMHEDYCRIAEARAKWWSERLDETGETEPKDILKASNKKPKKEKTGQAKLL